MITPRSATLALSCCVAIAATAGELKKDYFGATPPGAWAQYDLTSSDGTKSVSSSERKPDEDGRVVIEEAVKIKAGAGAGTESKTFHTMPKGFNLSRDWLSYGVQTEKMTMQYGSVTMPIDATTLAAIKAGSKDYRGAVTFEAEEKIGDRTCDRYAYAITIGGPAPSKEQGKLWLDATIPFGIVKQTTKTVNADGSAGTSFEVNLIETGRVQLETANAVEAVAPAKVELPSTVGLLDGYNAGRLTLEVSVVAGSGGRQLNIALKNEGQAELTVKVPAGRLDLPGSWPVEKLALSIPAATTVVIPAGETAKPFAATQQPGRGPVDGKFMLSVYENKPLFSGSATMGTVGR